MAVGGIFDNIKKHDYYTAILAMFAFKDDFPGMLKDCENMDDDIAAMKSWSETIDTIPKAAHVLAKQLEENG